MQAAGLELEAWSFSGAWCLELGACCLGVCVCRRAPLGVTFAPMKAVILAAGKGTRMRELTNELPKPMLKVEGKPILEHILEGILAAGIREVFIVTGFKAETIEDYFRDGSKWKARIAYGRQL